MNDSPSLFKLSAAISLVVFSSFTFSMMSACGHKGDESSQSDANREAGASGAGRIPTQGMLQAQRIAREAEVTCGDGVSCPEAIGMVVSTQESGVSTCTGFLIAPDLAVTSSLCVPADLRGGDASCGARMRILFPADPRGAFAAQEADCASVSMQPGDSHAYLRLSAASSRRPLAVDASGLPDGDLVQVPVVSPVSSTKPIGEIQMLSCRVAQHSVVLPEFVSPFSPVASLAGCQVGSTHPGAPVLDGRGAARAVIKGGFGGVEQYQAEFQQLLGPRQVPDFAFASNFACIKTPLAAASGRALPRACAPSRGAAPAGLPRAITPALVAAAQSLLAKQSAAWRSEPSHKLRWEMPPVGADAVTPEVRPQPSCIANPDRWLGEYSRWYSLWGYDEDAQFELSVPRYRIHYELNEQLRPYAWVTPLGSVPVLVTIHPRDIAKKGSTSVLVQAKLPNGKAGATLFSSASLRKCP